MAEIHLDTSASYWEVDGPDSFTDLFHALHGWLPSDGVLYFEGGSPDQEINEFMAAYSNPGQTNIAVGTIWPRPRIFHVQVSEAALTQLAAIMEHHAEPELAIHFHVYQGTSVLLEWHDAFSKPMLISSAVSEERVKLLTDILGTNYKRIY